MVINPVRAHAVSVIDVCLCRDVNHALINKDNCVVVSLCKFNAPKACKIQFAANALSNARSFDSNSFEYVIKQNHLNLST